MRRQVWQARISAAYISFSGARSPKRRPSRLVVRVTPGVPDCMPYRPAAHLYADDLDLFPDVLREYLAYVRDPVHGYVSAMLPVGDAMELSVRAR